MLRISFALTHSAESECSFSDRGAGYIKVERIGKGRFEAMDVSGTVFPRNVNDCPETWPSHLTLKTERATFHI